MSHFAYLASIIAWHLEWALDRLIGLVLYR